MKKRQVVLYIVLMLILITTSVYATISSDLSIKFKAKSDKFYPGDEFLVTLGLKNLESDPGIKSVEGYINIDENVLEPLTIDSIVKNDDGKVKIDENNNLSVYDANEITSSTDSGIFFNTEPVSEKGDYKVVINLDKAITSDTDLVTFNFKIKDNVTPGEYKTVMSYKLFKVFSDDAKDKLALDEKAYKITISSKDSSENNVVNNIVNNTTENNVISNNTVNNVKNETKNTLANKVVNNTVENKTKNTIKNTTSNITKNITNKNTNSSGVINKTSGITNTKTTDKTVSPTNLPKTGYKILILPIIVMAVIGLVFYKKYSKYNKYHE